MAAPGEAPGPRTSKAVPGGCLAPHQVSERAAESVADRHTGRKQEDSATRGGNFT